MRTRMAQREADRQSARETITEMQAAGALSDGEARKLADSQGV